VHGFGQADVANPAGLDLRLKLLGREGGADFFLEGQASAAGVLVALDANGVDATADGGVDEGKQVHEKAGVHARAEDGHAVLFRGIVDPLRQLGGGGPGIGQFLAGADDVQAVSAARSRAEVVVTTATSASASIWSTEALTVMPVG